VQERPLSLLWVCVGGGVERSTLLAAFGQFCASAGRAPQQLEWPEVDSSPASFIGALSRELGLEPDASPIKALYGRPARPVQLFDRADEGATAPPTASDTGPRLDEPELTAAVRQALRQFTSPDLLGRNPLVRLRMVAERAGGEAGIEERVAALQVLVQEVVGSLGASPRRAKLQRALYHTYLEPAGSQEQVAELLDLPFSTYRDHLKAGIQLVGEILWQRETDERIRPVLDRSASPADLPVLTGS
jgi:hypothetical protein